MAAALKRFLERMASDSSFRARYFEKPDEVIRESGLTSEEESLVKEGNEGKIQDYLGDDTPRPFVLVPPSGD